MRRIPKPLDGRKQPPFQIDLLNIAWRYTGTVRLFSVLVCISVSLQNENKRILKLCTGKKRKEIWTMT